MSVTRAALAALTLLLSGSLLPASAAPLAWRITKTEWSAADEKGFGDFVRILAESGCKTTVECMGVANPYRESDSGNLKFHADCAKWVYMLRAYYASKHGLPFSYVDNISGEGDDIRFSQTSNRALSRHDLVDKGAGIAADIALKNIHARVSTATYRMDPSLESPVEQDFYSPKLQPGSIHAGTAIYDTNGHVVIVYEVTADGRILYMDAHPDETVTRGAYGPQIPPSMAKLGGGFKNFRPLKLIGAVKRADGTYAGGHVVLARNDEIADFSLEQYRGAAGTGDGANPHFSRDGVALDLFGYVRAALSDKPKPGMAGIQAIVATDP
jgi:hypothetical protein